MMWRCACGHRVSRHDEPRQGVRQFYCLPERALRMFEQRPEDQRRVRAMPVSRAAYQATEGAGKRKGDFIETIEEEHYYD